MCGRYTANTEDEVIEIRGILAGLSLRNGYVYDTALSGKEIFPSDTAPVISADKGIVPARFGFNKWDGSGLIINARSETVESSRFFSPYLRNGRCVIPAHNYFEWEKVTASKKQKYRFYNTGTPLFMVGLINKDGFVIITKPAQENISFIHDRMPVLIGKNELGGWLNGSIGINSFICKANDELIFDKVV